MTKIQRLMRLHRLCAPAGNDGADTSGTDTTVEEEAEGEEAAEEEQEETGEEGDTEAAAEDDEVVITLGDEPIAAEDDEKRAPEWVRELRKSNREKDRRIRELEQKVTIAQPIQGAIVVGPEPTLESCDYDSDKFSNDLKSWYDRKRQVDEQAAKQKQAETTAQAAWQVKLDAYGKAKTALKVKDFEDAEAMVQDIFSVTQQGIMLDGADNAAILAYALGKNPKKAKELAAITSPVKFAFAMAKLEAQLKVQPKKSAPVPEKPIRSTAAGAAAIDNQLSKLQAEADKSGDRSKVAAYLRSKRA